MEDAPSPLVAIRIPQAANGRFGHAHARANPVPFRPGRYGS